jgi:hypothetical protein
MSGNIPNFANWNAFEKQFDAFTSKVEKRICAVHGNSTTALQELIIKRTPKLTHKMAANWQVTRNAPATAVILTGPLKNIKCDNNDYTAEVPATIAKAKEEVQKVTLGQLLYITNLTPYVTYVEYGTASYGFSPNAPAGMARISCMEWPQIVKAQVRLLGK